MYFNSSNYFCSSKNLIKTLLMLSFACLLLVCINIAINKSKNINIAFSSKGSDIEEGIDDDIDFIEKQNLSFDITVNQNNTFKSLLLSKNIDSKEVDLLDKELQKNKIPNQVFKGDKLKIGLKKTENPVTLSISHISLYSFKNSLQLEVVQKNNKFIIQKKPIDFVKSLVKISASVNSSIFETLRKLNIPASQINQIIKAYSHQIDFQKQVRKNDKMELIIEKYSETDGDLFYYGHIVWAKLAVGKEFYTKYRYSWQNNQYGYFSANGDMHKNSLLKNPIQAARISSHFGNRKHPILGYIRMHKGVDFAAAKGTPIYAAGDGKIIFMGRKKGYGNFIQIKHNNNLSTCYAHISKFHPSIKTGAQIKQGKTIAYVGSTGTSSGPHLHYEVRVNGTPVNPLSIKTHANSKLPPAELKKFLKYKDYLKEMDKILDTNNTYVLGKTISNS